MGKILNLISRSLLKKEIERIDNIENPDQDEKFFKSLCQRELLVLEKLMVEGIDMRGSVEEFGKRMDGKTICFTDSKEYGEMQRKAALFDDIQEFILDVTINPEEKPKSHGFATGYSRGGGNNGISKKNNEEIGIAENRNSAPDIAGRFQ